MGRPARGRDSRWRSTCSRPGTSTRTRVLWSDPRYFRCNSPSTLQAMWGADTVSSRKLIGADAAEERVVASLRDRLSRAPPSSRPTLSVPHRSTTRRCWRKRAHGADQRSTRATSPPPDWNGRYSRAISLKFMAATGRQDLRRTCLSGGAATVVLHGDQPDLDDPVAAHSGIPAPRSADALPPVRRQRAARGRRSSAGRTASCDLFSRQAHLAMDFVTTPERVQLMASSAENFIRHFNVGRAFDMSGAGTAARCRRAALVRREHSVLGP